MQARHYGIVGTTAMDGCRETGTERRDGGFPFHEEPVGVEQTGCMWIRIRGGAGLGDTVVSVCYRLFGQYEDKVI